MDRSSLDILNALSSDAILELGMAVSTPEGLATLLKRRPEVLELRRALDQGSITPEHLRQFAASVFQRFEAGKRFYADVTFCALAMAMETYATTFAEEYLRELSGLRIAEMPMSAKVAKIALHARARLLSGTIVNRVPHGIDVENAGRYYLVTRTGQVYDPEKRVA